MCDYTKLVSQQVWDELMKQLSVLRQRRFGRRRCAKEALLNGILQVLINGTAWGKIAFCGCSYVSCFRYFQEFQRRGKLKLIYKTLAGTKTDITEGMIDTTTVDSFEFRHLTGWDGYKKKVGTKVSLFVTKKDYQLMLSKVLEVSMIKILFPNTLATQEESEKNLLT